LALEGRDQVVGQTNDLQVESIGLERTGGDFPQRVILPQLADAQFHGGASIVEVPDASGSQGQVRDPGAIDVAAQSEESGLGLLFRKQSSCDHETTGLRPTQGAMLE